MRNNDPSLPQDPSVKPILSRELWETAEDLIPLEQPDRLPIRIGSINGVDVYLVDGNEVRANSFSDFVHGGNDAVYGPGNTTYPGVNFVPSGQIWLDGLETRDNMIPILYHEVIERTLMEEEGLTYDEAHPIANLSETTAYRTFGRKVANRDRTSLAELGSQAVIGLPGPKIEAVADGVKAVMSEAGIAGVVQITKRSLSTRPADPWRDRGYHYIMVSASKPRRPEVSDLAECAVTVGATTDELMKLWKMGRPRWNPVEWGRFCDLFGLGKLLPPKGNKIIQLHEATLADPYRDIFVQVVRKRDEVVRAETKRKNAGMDDLRALERKVLEGGGTESDKAKLCAWWERLRTGRIKPDARKPRPQPRPGRDPHAEGGWSQVVRFEARAHLKDLYDQASSMTIDNLDEDAHEALEDAAPEFEEILRATFIEKPRYGSTADLTGEEWWHYLMKIEGSV